MFTLLPINEMALLVSDKSMYENWYYVLMILYIFILMFLAKFMKEKLGIFKSIIIPTSLLAGFIGLIIGPSVLGILSENYFGQNIGLRFDTNFYLEVVKHAAAIGFIALALTDKKPKPDSKAFESGIMIVLGYIIQGIVGLGILLIMVNTFWPELFAGLGLLLPLAFGQGPAFSSTIGSGWEKTTGIEYIPSFALSLSTIGFLVGGIIGLIILNVYIKKNNLKPVRLRELKGIKSKNVEFKSLEEVNFFDNLTVQFTWIAILYVGAFLIISALVNGLNQLGNIGQTVGGIVSELIYLFGIILAIIFKKLLNALQRRGHRTKPLLNSYMMQNISSIGFNVMITASVMAIEISAVKDVWFVLLIVSIAGTIATYFLVTILVKKVFKIDTIHYLLVLFGMLTGTASTGIALLRGVDPELEKDIAEEVAVLGSAIALPLALPLVVLLGFPPIAYNENQPYLNFIALGVLSVYAVILIVFLLFFSKRKNRKIKNKSSVVNKMLE